jgi:hypothetical protein
LRERALNPRVKPTLKKRHFNGISEPENPEIIVREATNFLSSLQALRNEIIVRDEAYKAAKQSGDSQQMEHYHQLAKAISQKCLDYGRELCDNPIPNWVAGNLSKENKVITKHAYEVVRNKICTSLDVFDSDLLPNARTLIDFAEGRF